MKDITIRISSEEDLDLLSKLNRQLIEDEMHDNNMTLDQLKERMHGFLSSNYKAYLFMEGDDLKGYALINHAKQPLYLRQFYICRDSRRQGYGKVAFFKLLDYIGTRTIDIEVLYWNETGKKFWNSIGFEERSIYMRFE